MLTTIETEMRAYDALSWIGKALAGGPIPFGGWCMLAGLVPILSLVAVRIKATGEPERLKAAVDLYGIENDKYYLAYLARNNHSIYWRCGIPVFVMTLLNFYFATLMIYTPSVLWSPGGMTNFLLLGSKYGVPRTEATDYYMLQTFDTMCFAYLGWYVWTVATIFARIATMELVPATYYSLLIRLAVAIFVAVVFRHLFEFMLPSSATATTFHAEAAGFAAGLFPESLLRSITTWLRKAFLVKSEIPPELALDLIQGISPYRKLRLFEIGFDNCTNLATANPLTLYLASDLNLTEVIDWIAQAQLLVRFGAAKFATLQANGYRTVIDLKRGVGSPAVGRLAEITGFSQAQMEDLSAGLESDPSFTSLAALHDRIT